MSVGTRMIRLQRCAACGTAQYPPRAFCHHCLSDSIGWEEADALPGRLLARTRLHHTHEPRFRAHLPITLALVQLDAGPVAVCFLTGTAAPGDAVRVCLNEDDLLEAA
jgi:uncharacterized OB-fold protein